MRAQPPHGHNGPGPVGPLGATAAEVSQIIARPRRLFLTTGRLVGVVNDHRGTLVFVQNRVQPVAEEPADNLLRFHVPADVGKGRIQPKKVHLRGCRNRLDHITEKRLPAQGVAGVNAHVRERLGLLLRRQAEPTDHAVAHLGKIPVVVLGLNEHRTQGPRRAKAETFPAQRPKDHALHGEAGFPDARGAHQEHSPASAKKTVLDELVRVVFGALQAGQ